MNLPSLFLTVLSVFALTGTACLIGILVTWKTVGRHLGDLWPIIIIKLIQLISGAGSLFGAYSVGAQRDEWLPAVVAGLGCVAVWEIVGQLVDNRIKAMDRIDKAALERAEFQSKLRTILLTVFRFAVDVKSRRIRRQLEQPRRRLGTPHVRNALTPHPHLGDMLQNLAMFYQSQLPGGAGENRNFRVGVYLNVEGVMTPVQGISLNDSSYTPFRSYQAHQSAFRLDADANHPSHVVICVRQRRMIILEDCAKAANAGDFFFFTEGQRSYLRSMVAFYLGDVSRENGTMVEGALVVDTEAAGYFKESDRDSIEFCLREFAARLRLEMLLIALLAPKGANP